MFKALYSKDIHILWILSSFDLNPDLDILGGITSSLFKGLVDIHFLWILTTSDLDPKLDIAVPPQLLAILGGG